MRPNRSLNRTLCGGPGLGFKSLAQTRPAAKCRLASTLASSVEKFVAHQVCRFNFTQADTADRFFSKIQDMSCTLVNQSRTSRNVRYYLGGDLFNQQNIACVARDIEYFSKKSERPIVLYMRQLTATGHRTLRESIARQKHWFWLWCRSPKFKSSKCSALFYPCTAG